jgi:predicted ATPase/class 3 adenylate cyclase
MTEPARSPLAFPRGTITFLFTDVEGSTSAWLRDPVAMGPALARHDALIEQLVGEHAGHVVRPRGEGDSRFAVFARASDAVAAACAIQLALLDEAWRLTWPLRVRIAVHTGEADLRAGDYYGPAVNHCARLRSVAHGGQVLLSAVSADVVREALSAQVSLRDLGLHHLKDLVQPERVWQLVHPKLPVEFPPLTSRTSSKHHNLPNQLSSFVGRAREIDELCGLLAGLRLLTLTGPGGIGKTRLALRVASAVQADYADGVWLVRLEALADPDLVPAAVASVLNVREMPGRALIETLADAIGARQLLLVLDNCEHVIQPCAELAEALLQTCPRLQLLTTSREPLGVAGEHAWRAPPLSVPESQSTAVADPANQFDAVRLFVDRASAVRGGFILTDANAPAVAEVCRRLDGLPLAIELAAARVNALSVEQLAERVDDRLRLLTGGSRTALPRQQTLRAAIDWSYDLLSQPDRMLFRRLGVFGGGLSLEAAEAVCSGLGIAPEEMLDRLSSLVDKSLVGAEEHDGAKRYRLLETIRQHAQERLQASAEADVAHDQHAEYFLVLAERAEPELRGPEQVQWFERLELEHDNLRAALRWCMAHGDVDRGVRLAGAVWRFWQMRGHLTEGRKQLTQVLGLANAAIPLEPRTGARAAALKGCGALAWFQGDYTAASSLLEASLTIFRELGDRLGIASSLEMIGGAARAQGEYARARPQFEESLTIFRELGDRWGIAAALNDLGLMAQQEGDYGLARSLYEESLPLFRVLGDRRGIASVLSNLGGVAGDQGDYGPARSLSEEGLAIHRELGDQWGIARALYNLATLAQHEGNYATAQSLYEDSLALAWELGSQETIARSAEGLAAVAAAQGRAVRALRIGGAADRLRATICAPLSAAENGLFQRMLQPAVRRLGATTAATVWAEGQTMLVDEAVVHNNEDLAEDPIERMQNSTGGHD